eukprot:TRINITY_DN5213_c1_g3_i1.p1 TRINITY_DN5213_c1_g3~~TRINITY_DN5213_c1_g3_i1.p1  ORF type:complete len:508 (+),score=116.00 TRINITY_DN5213_c1_g3_i1:69-1592(+)
MASIEASLAEYYRRHNPRMVARVPGLARKAAEDGDLDGLRQRLLSQYPGTEADLAFLEGHSNSPERPARPPRCPAHDAADARRRGKPEQDTHWQPRQGGRSRADGGRAPSPFAVERKDLAWEPQGPPPHRRVRNPGMQKPEEPRLSGAPPANATAEADWPAPGRRQFAPGVPAGASPNTCGAADQPVGRSGKRTDLSPSRQGGGTTSMTGFGPEVAKGPYGDRRGRASPQRANARSGSPFATSYTQEEPKRFAAPPPAPAPAPARGGYSSGATGGGITADSPVGPLKTSEGTMEGCWFARTRNEAGHIDEQNARLVEVLPDGSMLNHTKRNWFTRSHGQDPRSWGCLIAASGGEWTPDVGVDAARAGLGNSQDDPLAEDAVATVSEHYGTTSQGLTPKYLEWDDGEVWLRQGMPTSIQLTREAGESTGLYADVMASADAEDGVGGVYFDEVKDDGPADRAGFHRILGRILLDIDGVPVRNMEDLKKAVPRDGDWTTKTFRFKPNPEY